MSDSTHRMPSKPEAYLCLACVAACIFGCTSLGAPIQFGVVMATAVAFLFARRLGFTWEEMEARIHKRIGKLAGTMLIMWMIGFLLGSMLYSGLLPMLVYYGFELIDPRFLYFSALLACMLMSTMTGSSWSAAGTAGVACMALAHGHGADLGIMAGAVVAGSVFGDKLSPMSETTNLAPACAGTDLYSHIKAQLWTTVPAISIAGAAFLFLGRGMGTLQDDLPETAVAIMSQLEAMYSWSLLLLLPVAALLVLSAMRKPVVPVMLVCGVLNLVVGRAVQGYPLEIGFTACVTGFRASMVAPMDMPLDPKVEYILNRGGMTGMVSIILICFCGFSMTTVLAKSGVMEVAVRPLLGVAHKRWVTMLTAELATLAIAAMAGISYMSSVFVGEAWREPFLKSRMGLPCLSRTLEDVGTCCTAVVPWCSSAVFFSSTLEVPVWGAGGFGAYTFLPFLCPAFAFLLACAGLGLYPAPEDAVEAEIRSGDTGDAFADGQE